MATNPSLKPYPASGAGAKIEAAAPTADAQQDLKTIRVSRTLAKHNRVVGDSELAEIIEQILQKLVAELPGILNWAINGYSEWRRIGLGTPKVVLDATAEYREEEDEVGEFISETCLLEGRIDRKVLYDAFKAWVTNRGIKFLMTQKAFAKRLRARGVQDGGKSTSKRFWRGITLRPEVELTAEHRLIHHIIPSLP